MTITWRNVAAPDTAGASSLLNSALEGFKTASSQADKITNTFMDAAKAKRTNEQNEAYKTGIEMLSQANDDGQISEVLGSGILGGMSGTQTRDMYKLGMEKSNDILADKLTNMNLKKAEADYERGQTNDALAATERAQNQQLARTRSKYTNLFANSVNEYNENVSTKLDTANEMLKGFDPSVAKQLQEDITVNSKGELEVSPNIMADGTTGYDSGTLDVINSMLKQVNESNQYEGILPQDIEKQFSNEMTQFTMKTGREVPINEALTTVKTNASALAQLSKEDAEEVQTRIKQTDAEYQRATLELEREEEDAVAGIEENGNLKGHKNIMSNYGAKGGDPAAYFRTKLDEWTEDKTEGDSSVIAQTVSELEKKYVIDGVEIKNPDNPNETVKINVPPEYLLSVLDKTGSEFNANFANDVYLSKVKNTLDTKLLIAAEQYAKAKAAEERVKLTKRGYEDRRAQIDSAYQRKKGFIQASYFGS